MTAQTPDSLIWKKKEYGLPGFDGYEEEIPLFNPEDRGFHPLVMHT